MNQLTTIWQTRNGQVERIDQGSVAERMTGNTCRERKCKETLKSYTISVKTRENESTEKYDKSINGTPV